MENVKKSFLNESRDASWSSATHDAILDALDGNKLRDALASVECRSQTCRVEIADKGNETSMKMPLVALKLARALPKVEYDLVDDGGGHQSTVLYMSRYDDPAPADLPQPPR
jgi:hypothetical protein